MAVAALQQQYTELITRLLEEEILDDQFTQLQLLQDESNPEFVTEVITLFFEDSEKLLQDLTTEVETTPVDYKKVDSFVHQLKGSSSRYMANREATDLIVVPVSIGAQRVKAVCIEFRTFCDNENADGCKEALGNVKKEFDLVKKELTEMLELEEKILAAGGTLPSVE
eukprot:SM000241S08503  [mRNA]  locus=s241:177999:179910:+ [translate_table: standard]